VKKSAREYLALALDNISSLQALSTLIFTTAPWIGVFKIGLEQFTRFGPPVLDLVRKADRKIFLDLKFHDIPNTVHKAVLSACDLGVDYLTIHTLGGIGMMRAAMEAANVSRRPKTPPPKIIGVTLLTSIDADCLNNELSVAQNLADYVRHLAMLAIQAKLDGIVCSASDLLAVKPVLPCNFEIITPGIRPAGVGTNDQKRTASPEEAIKNGATLLVLGRAVTETSDPVKIVEEISGVVCTILNQ
jgi:orotidine-5'-phosphate decarboxylase